MKFKKQVAGALAGVMVLSMGSTAVFAQNYIKSPDAWGFFDEEISSGMHWEAYSTYDEATDTYSVAPGSAWISITEDALTDLNGSIKTALAFKATKDGSQVNNLSIDGVELSKLSISKENMQALKDREAWVGTSGEDKADGYGYNISFGDITAVKEFSRDLSPATNEKAAAKLKAAGYDKYSRMLTISGTGKLGTALSIEYWNLNENSVPQTYENSYLYYYNAASDSFELVDEFSKIYSDDYMMYLSSDNSAGTYVWTLEKLPASVAATIAYSGANLVDADTTDKATKALSDDIKEMLEDKTLASGDQYAIVMEKKDVKVAKSIFTQLKDAGVTPRIEDVNQASTWVFKDMSNLDAMTGDFDPTTTIGSGILPEVDKLAAAKAKDIKYTTVSFAYDGKLPGKTDVTLDLSNAGIFTEGQTVYMYLYDATSGAFTEEKSATYVNGFATFNIDHCSDYIVTASQIKAVTDSANAPKTGDTTSTLAFVLALFAGLIACGYGIYRRVSA